LGVLLLKQERSTVIEIAQNDKELLELAAKAAGYEVMWHESWQCFTHANPFNITNPPTMSGQRIVWIPLDDDGDAFRMSVQLRLYIHHDDLSPTVSVCGGGVTWIDEPHGNDPYSATRRVIVRAAAEIGRNMK
jgi:hypothetical protein